MISNGLQKDIDAYIDNNWEQIVDDIGSLVSIASWANDSHKTKEYPSGRKPLEAMEAGLKIAKRLGFKTKNHNNIIGIADIAGASKTEVGFIAHMDVVPDGYGWKFPPFELSRVNGYLIGRGVVDDKGPAVLTMHAVNFWREQGYKFPYSIRVLLGTDEETAMNDVDYFLKNFDEPKVVISPDSDFPVCYGEKGIFQARVTSPKIENGQILEIEAGTTENAVAGIAYAHVQLPKHGVLFKEGSRLAHAIIIEPLENDVVRIIAHGISAHACTPYEGIDGIAILAQFMLEKNLGNQQEQEFLRFVAKIAGKPDGHEVGIDREDEYFGELTIVPSMLYKHNGSLVQVFDTRYPSNIDDQEILEGLQKNAPKNCTFKWHKDKRPFLINPDSKLVQSLTNAYTSATGEEREPYTMGGGTYACRFKCATSFGPEMPWKVNPAWIGGIHGPDEGVSEQQFKEALKIYIITIKNLMELDLDDENFEKDVCMP